VEEECLSCDTLPPPSNDKGGVVSSAGVLVGMRPRKT